MQAKISERIRLPCWGGTVCSGTAGRALLFENNEGTVVCTVKEAAGRRRWQLSPTCSSRGSCQPTGPPLPVGHCTPANEPRSEAQGHRRSCRLTGFSCRRLKLTAATPWTQMPKALGMGSPGMPILQERRENQEAAECCPGLSPRLELVLALRSGFAASFRFHSL